MGGYREILNGLDGPIYGMHVHSNNPTHIITMLHGAGIDCLPIDNEGVGGATYDRTPAAHVTGDYVWSVDTMFDSTGTPAVKIIAHAATTSWSDADSDAATPVNYGSATATAILAPFAAPQSVSGGIVVLQPFLFIYGSNGLIKNSIANDPAIFTGGDSNTANVSGTKVIKGLPLRGF